jgi:hypothetical protein
VPAVVSNLIITPSSGTATLEDTPRRKAARGFPDGPFPELKNVPSPRCPLAQVYPCKCGPVIECPANYGSDDMMPDRALAAVIVTVSAQFFGLLEFCQEGSRRKMDGSKLC